MSCFDRVIIELQWVTSYIQLVTILQLTVYMIATHATCPLTLIVYKYNELQVFGAIKKLSYKANCKIPLFLIVIKLNQYYHIYHMMMQQ